MKLLASGFAAAMIFAFTLPADAKDFPYRRNVTLSVGGSTVLKGVRSGDCSDSAPSWSRVSRGLPKSKLGSFSDGGEGTVKSNSCGQRVGARGVRFTAKTKGTERFVIFDDTISVTVK